MVHQDYFVYIVTNKTKAVIYTGITKDLKRRLHEHYEQRGRLDSFSARYHTYNLLYFEHFRYVRDAIAREKEIKGWRREKKLNLIKTVNPSLVFLNNNLDELISKLRK